MCSCWFFVCSLSVSLVSGKRQKVLYVVSVWSWLLSDSVYLVQRMREGSFCMSLSCCSVEVRSASGSFILAGGNSSEGVILLHDSSSDSSVPDVSIEYLIVVFEILLGGGLKQVAKTWEAGEGRIDIIGALLFSFLWLAPPPGLLQAATLK
ncbi:hypothetical protein POTOM_033462 [Populus tomentosa]|uniref:Secreted protein n=1 Tax=Populus tomentosa TaxID=118781 RepID=A0A8X8CQP8_POPTO|nr:hypothetical protein POTOM_033462 [Populus tomentosa]